MPSKTPSPVEKWSSEAKKLPTDELKVPVPLYVLFAEAVDLARFCERYYRSTPERAGLESVASKARGIGKDTGKKLLSLRQAAHDAATAYRMSRTPGTPAPVEEAREVLDEIKATLAYLFDDGVEDERSVHLAALKKEHGDRSDSHDALAAKLDDYAGLAERHAKEMKGLGGFDLALLGRARELAAQFRDRPAMPAVLPKDVARARGLRNRLATLLWQRMSAVRSAARFVFRKQPAIIREATSSYERTRRTEARRAAKAKKKGAESDA